MIHSSTIIRTAEERFTHKDVDRSLEAVIGELKEASFRTSWVQVLLAIDFFPTIRNGTGDPAT